MYTTKKKKPKNIKTLQEGMYKRLVALPILCGQHISLNFSCNILCQPNEDWYNNGVVYKMTTTFQLDFPWQFLKLLQK